MAIHCGGCMIDHQKMRARWVLRSTIWHSSEVSVPPCTSMNIILTFTSAVCQGHEMEEASTEPHMQACTHICTCCTCTLPPFLCSISDMEEAGVPVTNYGLFLSYVHSPAALARAMEPWGLTLPVE